MPSKARTIPLFLIQEVKSFNTPTFFNITGNGLRAGAGKEEDLKKKRILPHARRVWGKGKEWAVGDGGRRKELTACD